MLWPPSPRKHPNVVCLWYMRDTIKQLHLFNNVIRPIAKHSSGSQPDNYSVIDASTFDKNNVVLSAATTVRYFNVFR